MYQKYLYIIPPAGERTRLVISEIIKTKQNGKNLYWFTNKDNNFGLYGMEIISLNIEEWTEFPLNPGNIYQIICENNTVLNDVDKVFCNIIDDSNAVIVIDSVSQLLGSGINSLLERHAADIYLFSETLEQVYICISANLKENMEYKEKKFIERCRKEFNTYEKNRIFWMENRGITKVRRRPGDAPNTPTTCPLPSYQPSTIFNCTLYHFKIGSLPGMTIEEMIENIRR